MAIIVTITVAIWQGKEGQFTEAKEAKKGKQISAKLVQFFFENFW